MKLVPSNKDVGEILLNKTPETIIIQNTENNILFFCFPIPFDISIPTKAIPK